VWNKIDLGFKSRARLAGGASPAFRGEHRVSARTGDGVADLSHAVWTDLASDVASGVEAESAWVANERHARLLEDAGGAMDRALGALDEKAPLELVAADLHRCLDALAGIAGTRAGAELLEEIFSRFCIGK
jgi:tRNA modification GTPase